MTQGRALDLVGSLARVLLDLERSADAEAQALVERLQSGTHTPHDIRRVADLIEELVEGTPPGHELN